MQAYFGLPHIFLTITPDLNNSYRLAYYSGDLINADLLHNSDFKNLPSKSIQYKISSTNPVTCAKLFDRLITIFLSTLIGNMIYFI